MDDKKIEKLLKSDVKKISSNSFAAIREKVEKTDRYLALQLKKETEQMIPNSVPKVEPKPSTHLHFNWKVFTPVAVSCCILVALPIVITQVNKPVTQCDAYVGVSYEDDENTLDLRAKVQNDKVDIDSLTAVGELGNMLISGIIKENKFDSDPLLSEFIPAIRNIAEEYTLIDSKAKQTLEFICKNEEVGKKYTADFGISEYLLMGDGTDILHIDSIITIYDISNRLFDVHIDKNTFFENIKSTFKNNDNLSNIAAKLEQINKFLLLDNMVKDFLNDPYFASFRLRGFSLLNLLDDIQFFIERFNLEDIVPPELAYWARLSIDSSVNKDDYYLDYWYNMLNLKRGRK